MEPLLRYAGNKRRLADFIISHLQPTLDDRGRYLELFAGGAAVFFKLEPKRAVLVDVCKPIISFYEAVQREPDAVNDEIDKISRLTHNSETYYKIRSEWSYNDFGPKFAARLLYLNKTGYNGLFRLNSKLEYNVPWGDKKRPPKYPSPELVNQASGLLKNTTLYAADYGDILSKTHKYDTVYCDPPYWNMYDKYSGGSFSNDNHKELSVGLRRALDRGVHVFESNIDCDGVRELYQDWSYMHIIPIRHTIAAKANNRRVVNEVLIVATAPFKDPKQLSLV